MFSRLSWLIGFVSPGSRPVRPNSWLALVLSCFAIRELREICGIRWGVALQILRSAALFSPQRALVSRWGR